MDKVKKFLPCVIIIIVIGGLAFYGGMKYGGSQASNLQNSAAGRQAFQQGSGATAGGNFAGRRSGGVSGGFTAGQVISKDANSITLQLNNNGGSKIVFFSTTTQISKYATSTIDQLKTGEQIIVNGSANSDGSITAQSIQLGVSTPKKTQDTKSQQ